MSYRVSQRSPHSTNPLNLRVSFKAPWSDGPENFQEMQFWRSWLEFDSQLDRRRSKSRVNWNAIFGLALTAGVSAGFWTGVGLTIARLVR